MKPETVQLSIIIPIYNVEAYLPQTLENVLSQNLRDFELILVDDGSTDGSGAICDAFAEKDKRVRVVHQKNAGVSAARNTGVAAAQGRYIGFVDSDDLIEPNMFDTLLEIAERRKADVVQCRHDRLTEVQEVSVSGEERILDGQTFVREMFGYQGGDYTNQVSLCSKIYRRELFQHIHFPEGQTYEDEQETYKLCLHANRIVQIPDRLYHYVKRENSIITGVSAKKMLDKQLALMDRLNYLPQRLPDLDEVCARSFIGYSENAMCQLYLSGEIETLDKVFGNVMRHKRILSPYWNKYERIYFPLLCLRWGKKWVLGNEFEPVQKAIKRFR